jgi:hypothetical protein
MIRRGIREQLDGLKIDIGGVVMKFVCYDEIGLTIDSSFRSFIVDTKPDIIFRVHDRNIPDFNLGKKVLDASPWSIHFNKNDKILFWLHRPTNFLPHVLVVSSIYTKYIDIYVDTKEKYFTYSLTHFMSPPILSYLLLPYRCLVMHGCGIKYEENGLLFVGKSDAGKSTICNLWKDEPNVLPLSDDRIIIRNVNDSFLIYGTPWYSSAKIASPSYAKLDKVFLIYHSKENVIIRKEKIDAMTTLLTNSYMPLWNRPKMEDLFQLLDELSSKIPCYDLGFLPDKSIIGFLRHYGKD